MTTWTEPLTRAEVADAVASRLGCSRDEAAEMVTGYIAETAERVGTTSVALWPLDEADVEAITSSSPSTTATAAAVAEAMAATATTSIQADASARAMTAEESRGDEHEHVEADAG